MSGQDSHRYHEFDKKQLRALIRARLLTIEEFAARAEINANTLYAILTRNPDSDTVGVEMATARKIIDAVNAIPPILIVGLPAQRPVNRRKLPDTMANPLFPEARLPAHAELEAQREADRHVTLKELIVKAPDSA